MPDPAPAPAPARLGQLDGVRAVSIGVVMAHHAVWAAPAYAHDWVQGTWSALDSFFVLSGFLICGLLVNEHERYGSIAYVRFLGRRLLRLYPALLLALAATTFVAVRYDHLSFHSLVPTLRASALYVMNWSFGHSNAAPGFPAPPASFAAYQYTHLWSLAVEFQFYLVLPLVLVVLYRVRASRPVWLATFGALIVASAVSRAIQWRGAADFPGPYVYTHTRADVLLWGVVAALIVHWGWITPRFRQVLRVAGPVGVAFVTWMVLTRSSDDAWTYDWGMALSGPANAAVVLWLVSSPRDVGGRVLGWGPIRYLGTRSYSAYLWHYPVFFYVAAHLPTLTGRERVAVGLLITLVLSDLTYRLVERPVFSLKDRLLPRRGRDAVPTTGSPAPSR